MGRTLICQRRRGGQARVALPRDAGDGDLVAADHEVDVDRAAVAPLPVLVRRPWSNPSPSAMWLARSRRGGCRRRCEPIDAAFPVDECHSRDSAPSSRAARPPTAAPCSASIAAAAPSNRTARPRMIAPSASTSGFVDRTTPPPVRDPGGVDLLSGQVGGCTIPSTSRQCTVKGGGGQQPDGRVSSGHRVERVEATLVHPRGRGPAHLRARSRPPPGPGSSRRQTCAISPRVAPTHPPAELRMGEPGPAMLGHGTTVQFVVRSLITSRISLTNGSWSRPAARGRDRRAHRRARPGREILPPARCRARAGWRTTTVRSRGLLGRMGDTGSLDVQVSTGRRETGPCR
jgi:hypothetical protein